MNKLVYSALTLTLVGAPSHASENDWASLDQEIEALSASLSSQGNGPGLSGWIIAAYRNSSDIENFENSDGDLDNQLGGFTLDSIRLNVEGEVDDYGYMVSYDLYTQTASLKDAYMSWAVGDSVNLQVGQFRAPFLRSALIDRNRLLFQDRGALGVVFATRDPGVMVSGNFDTVSWYLAAQNGDDGAGEDLRVTARVEVALMGDGVGMVEGAYGAGDDLNLTLGGAYGNIGGMQDGGHFTADVNLTSGPFGVSAEVVSFEDGADVAPGSPKSFGSFWEPVPGAVEGSGGPSVIGFREVADVTPWGATVSYMVTPDEWEAAVRYADSDNDDDENTWTIGVNRYVKGHDIKWSINYTIFQTDGSGLDDIDMITVGMALSF